MESFATSLDLLYADGAVPVDGTGSLRQIAALLGPVRPALLFLVDADHSVTAAYNAAEPPDGEGLRAVVEALEAGLVREERVVVRPRTGGEAGTVFGVRLAAGGLLGGLLPPGSETSLAADCSGGALQTCGELAATALAQEAELRQLRAALRQLTAGQDTLKAAHAKAVAEAVAEQEQRIREEQQRTAMQEVCQATEAANRAKSQFLANMSHEIRTPLNAILGFTELLLKGADGGNKAERADFLETIHNSGIHLMELINDILDLSKIEAGRMEVEHIPCAPVALVQTALTLVRSRAEEQNVQLSCEVQDGVPDLVVTDPVRLKQLLMNLLSNAVKFTPSGMVRVVVRPVGGGGQPKLAFDVIDSGIGIPPEKLDAIFDAFVQADNSVTRQYGGTGLGLPISRRIARALGGELELRSEPGKGSTFTATIGAAPCSATVKTSSPTNGAPAPSGSLDSALRTLRGKRMLVVDDGPSNRKLIDLVLRRAGVEVALAAEGRMAVELAASQTFDLILMDMQMPVMDGYTATRELRRRGLTIPIIALTAHAMREDRGKCLEAGCSGYLPKPIQQEPLLTELARALRPPPGQNSDVAERTLHESDLNLVSTLPLDDPEFREIVEEFVLSLPDQLLALRDACEAGDFEQLTRLAHRLKGSSGMAGFPDLMTAAKQVEDRARTKHGDGAATALETLCGLCARAACTQTQSPA